MVSTLRESDSAGRTCGSFLRTDLNSKSHNNIALETVVRAGCSKEAVALTRQLEISPSEVEELVTKFNEEDGALLAQQLKKELTDEWSSSSLFGGLGADQAGLVVGDSLLQTYDLLCNINLHLLIMQRELLKHEEKIRELCSKDETTTSSFADHGNKNQLLRLLRSLSKASASLRDRIFSLQCTITGDSLESAKNKSFISNLSYLTCGIGVFFGLILLRHQFSNLP
ncbi:hypothetical protein GCK32_016327 [Trichostrongylus colubriformis]|uniref:Uncharacterized protein n=1 Tax=Trichostrongylus colubriformis TaxID=6319 RepID=A0AAN8FSS8_TRICO